jgi:hypothetical protein
MREHPRNVGLTRQASGVKHAGAVTDMATTDSKPINYPYTASLRPDLLDSGPRRRRWTQRAERFRCKLFIDETLNAPPSILLFCLQVAKMQFDKSPQSSRKVSPPSIMLSVSNPRRLRGQMEIRHDSHEEPQTYAPSTPKRGGMAFLGRTGTAQSERAGSLDGSRPIGR